MPDIWADWLLRDRFGGADPAGRDSQLGFLRGVRDRVLDAAALTPGDVVLDAGCGDGLIGFGALARLGPAGRLICADISADLLEECRSIAAGDARVSFVRTGFPDLAAIPDASIDVVTVRSVLIYVADLPASFAAMRRVLRPGGRLSVFEPINSYGGPPARHRLWGVDVTGLEPLADRVRATYRELAGPGGETMVAFDERDLVRLVEAAGFDDVALDYRATVRRRHPPGEWEPIAAVPPNPLVPSLGRIVARALPAGEADVLVGRIRAELHAGRREVRQALAYVSARA